MGLQVVEFLHHTRRPFDAQCVDPRRVGQPKLRVQALLVLLAPLFGIGCLDQDSVYGDDRPEGEPPVAANGMIGYGNEAAGQTVCGNCHAQPQAQWSGTKHADAWETLQASGHAQEFCEACHSVSELGNAATTPSGYTATGAARYRDVQCESCHGAGAEHVSDPEAVQPTPSISVLAADGTTYLNCAECHNGTHHPFVEQWSLSKHSEVVTFAASRLECAWNGSQTNTRLVGLSALRRGPWPEPHTITARL